MNKIKNIIAVAVFTVLMYACGDNNNVVNIYANVDHKALTVSENDSIVYFLKTHYYDSSLDSIKLITNSQKPMFEDAARLSTKTVVENDITHQLYIYVTEVGIPDFKDKSNPSLGRKDNPTEVDSIFVSRKGVRLVNNAIDLSSPFDQADQTWWSLISTFNVFPSAPSPIKAWVKGFPYFKSGQNVTNNGPITYSNTGKGYFFIPSGLGYSSINYQIGQTPNALFDQTIVFKVELLDIVENTDHDNDGKATIDEDANGDKDPTNDFSDSSKPTLPDYLNPNIK